MFIGHFGVALAAKRIAPRTSLGTLVMAAQFVDLIWPFFLLLGVERVIVAPGTTAVTPLDFVSYPISHSLLADIGWAFLFAGVYRIVKRDTRGAVCLWFVVISHWLLDALSHAPDLPLYPGSSIEVGLGLWNSPVWTFLIESAIFILGIRIYTRATRPLDRLGTLAFRTLVAFLFLFYCVNFFGPPPPSEKAVMWGAFGMWVFVAWGYWLDRHRFVAPPAPVSIPPAPLSEQTPAS